MSALSANESRNVPTGVGKYLDRAQVVEYEVHCFNAEASELGWPPGFVPKEMATNLGNKQPLILQSYNAERFVYSQIGGCIRVIIYND